MATLTDYPFEIHPLSGEDGGGYLITFPDFPGCMSDGETPQEAIENGTDALKAFLAVKNRHGDAIPEPGECMHSSRFVTKVPKMLYAKLAIRAENEETVC